MREEELNREENPISKPESITTTTTTTRKGGVGSAAEKDETSSAGRDIPPHHSLRPASETKEGGSGNCDFSTAAPALTSDGSVGVGNLTDEEKAKFKAQVEMQGGKNRR